MTFSDPASTESPEEGALRPEIGHVWMNRTRTGQNADENRTRMPKSGQETDKTPPTVLQYLMPPRSVNPCFFSSFLHAEPIQ